MRLLSNKHYKPRKKQQKEQRARSSHCKHGREIRIFPDALICTRPGVNKFVGEECAKPISFIKLTSREKSGSRYGQRKFKLLFIVKRTKGD